MGEVLEMVLAVQREYVYMDNIFSGEDIRKQLPKETNDFDKVTSEWIEHTSRMAVHGLALPATHDPRTYTYTLRGTRKIRFLTKYFENDCADCFFVRTQI